MLSHLLTILYVPLMSTLMHTNAYKGGGGGCLNMTKNTHLIHRFIENATVSETLKDFIF